MRKILIYLMLGLTLGFILSGPRRSNIKPEEEMNYGGVTTSLDPSCPGTGRAFYTKRFGNGQIIEKFKVNYGVAGFGDIEEFPRVVYFDFNGDGAVDEIAFEDPLKLEELPYRCQRVLDSSIGSVTRLKRDERNTPLTRKLFIEADSEMQDFMSNSSN